MHPLFSFSWLSLENLLFFMMFPFIFLFYTISINKKIMKRTTKLLFSDYSCREGDDTFIIES